MLKALINNGFDEQFLPEVLKDIIRIHTQIIMTKDFVNLEDAYSSFNTLAACNELLDYYGHGTWVEENSNKKWKTKQPKKEPEKS